MSGLEQMPAQNGGQVSGAIGAVSLGMPTFRTANNPFMAAPDDSRWEGQEAWKDLGLCNQVGQDGFYLEKGESPRDAKKVCGYCEVKPECLQYALDNGERFGVWGGMTERERRKLKKTMSQETKSQA